MKYLWLFILIESISPTSRVHNVDLLELNFVKNEHHSFCQLIVWERVKATGQYVVRDWDIIDPNAPHFQIPVESPEGYKCVWIKTSRPILLQSPLLLKTYTTYDRERENQKILHPDFRLKLPE